MTQTQTPTPPAGTAVTRAEPKKLSTFDEIRQTLLSPDFSSQLKMALPPHIPVDRFQRIVVTAISQKPDLLTGDRRSLFTACLRSAQDGLLPDGREATLQIYNTNVGTSEKPNWVKMVQYMPMIEGLRKKVRNSGEIIDWSIRVVKEKDEFTYELGDSEKIVHKPALRDRGATIGAYSIVTFKSGEKSREFMDVDQIEDVRKRSKTPNAGPWKSDYDEMCRKTVGRRHYKALPKSTDIDGFMQHIDDLYDMRPNAAEPAPSAQVAPPPKARPRRLQRVVDAAAAAATTQEPGPAAAATGDDNHQQEQPQAPIGGGETDVL